MGSSPRLRGTWTVYTPGSALTGIIPALAGNIMQVGRRTQDSRDHPRACGEHIYPTLPYRLIVGSSPRLRGTCDVHAARCLIVGIIHALAGNIAGCNAGASSARDHPRACGEHRFGLLGFSPTLGSSPRLRGTSFRTAFDCRVVGIIPALAGNIRR